MHYVCIEDNKVIGVLQYQPNVPGSISVVQITDDQAVQLQNSTHVFNVTSRTVEPVSGAVISQRAQDLANSQEREFLNSTDWKVLRHIRQKALGVPTSLSDSEYITLENQRQQAASRIV